jgi:YVTN family beta-propeller protein
VTNFFSQNVSVIDTATNKVTATVKVGTYPLGVAVDPNGKKLYVTNLGSSDVSVIDTGTNTVKATVPIEKRPAGVAVTQNKKMYKWKLVL